jgi:hypothetical protein
MLPLLETALSFHSSRQPVGRCDSSMLRSSATAWPCSHSQGLPAAHCCPCTRVPSPF